MELAWTELPLADLRSFLSVLNVTPLLCGSHASVIIHVESEMMIYLR